MPDRTITENERESLNELRKLYINDVQRVLSINCPAVINMLNELKKSNSQLYEPKILEGTSKNYYDLHQMRASEAYYFVAQQINNNTNTLFFMTGKGIHSTDGKSVLKPVLKQLCIDRAGQGLYAECGIGFGSPNLNSNNWQQKEAMFYIKMQLTFKNPALEYNKIKISVEGDRSLINSLTITLEDSPPAMASSEITSEPQLSSADTAGDTARQTNNKPQLPSADAAGATARQTNNKPQLSSADAAGATARQTNNKPQLSSADAAGSTAKAQSPSQAKQIGTMPSGSYARGTRQAPSPQTNINLLNLLIGNVFKNNKFSNNDNLPTIIQELNSIKEPCLTTVDNKLAYYFILREIVLLSHRTTNSTDNSIQLCCYNCKDVLNILLEKLTTFKESNQDFSITIDANDVFKINVKVNIPQKILDQRARAIAQAQQEAIDKAAQEKLKTPESAPEAKAQKKAPALSRREMRKLKKSDTTAEAATAKLGFFSKAPASSEEPVDKTPKTIPPKNNI